MPGTKHSTEYKLIAKSKYFNRRWYLKHYPDVASSGIDPVKHYLRYGWREGRNPGPNFNTREYLRKYPDCKIVPLIDLISRDDEKAQQKTEYKIISHSKYFDKKWYLNVYSDVKRAGVDPVQHYMTCGWSEGRNPSPKFNTNGYLKRYPECKINPVVHFETVGRRKHYQTGQFIDERVNKDYWAKHNKKKQIRQVIYSCISGGYDEIITDFCPNPDYDYVLFTDNTGLLKKKTFLWWQIRPLAFSEMDSVRNARWHKLHPHILFPEYDYSVWLDSNVQISGNKIYNLLKKHIQARHKVASSIHPYRDCIYDEADMCIVSGKDNSALINKQMVLLHSKKYPAHNGLYETNVLLRRHNDKGVIDLCNQWWDFIKNYSRRDQLSFNYLLWKNGIKHYPIDKKSLRFHPEFKLIFHNYKPAVTKYTNNKILVHLHLFYTEQLDWFLRRLKNITCNYDLCVTVVKPDATIEKKIMDFKPDAKILVVPNRGYDVYPFWLALQDFSLSDYDFVLKLHTKNSRTTKWTKNGISYTGFEWRDDLINPLIGSRRQFHRVRRLLACPGVGMVGAANLIGDRENAQQMNNTKKLCDKMGIRYFDKCPFVCGTMFAIKSDLLREFQNYPFRQSDFSAESKTGSVGTTAHSLETVFGILVANGGLKLAGVHNSATWRKALRANMKQFYIKLLKKTKQYKNDVEYIRHSRLFDKKWYLKTYPDVAACGISPAQHYLNFGWLDGKNPSPKFNTRLYLDNNRDVASAAINPLLHYEKHGKYENRFTGTLGRLSSLAVKELCDARKMCSCNTAHVDRPVIISLTTYPARIGSVHHTVRSLRRQSVTPDKIILYLSYEEFPKMNRGLPRNLTAMLDDVFEIHWIDKTLRSFQKLIPALCEYPDAIIVTADDDILYDDDWLARLLDAYKSAPNLIHCHRAHRIKMNGKYVAPYNSWHMAARNESVAYNNFLTGVGGVLYPPHCLDENVINDDEFLELCPRADDIWIWAMAVKNHTKIHIIRDNIAALNFVPGSQDGECLWKINTVDTCYNDVQLKNVLEKYPMILDIIRRERNRSMLAAYLLYPWYWARYQRIKKTGV